MKKILIAMMLFTTVAIVSALADENTDNADRAGNPNTDSRMGDVVLQFSAPGPSPQDLAWDGECLWLVDDSTLQFMVVGNLDCYAEARQNGEETNQPQNVESYEVHLMERDK